MDTELVQAVKKETEQVFGRKIVSSRDCNALSEEIFYKTGYQINSNTLRRFFGLVKSSYAPSSGTIQILCTYCGFTSCEELKKLHEGRKGEEIILKEENILYYLVFPFKNIKVIDKNDETFLSLVKGVIIFINRYPQLSFKFHLEIAKTKNGQDFYFEQFINYDKLNSFYGEGLRYYLAEKKSTDGQIFGHSLLVFRYWLTKENENLNRHFRTLKTIKREKKLNPFICGRYYASRLYHSHANGFDAERILVSARKSFYTLQVSQENFHLSTSFEYIFAEALVLTGHFEEGLFYLEKINKRALKINNEVDIQFSQTLTLLETLALYETGSSWKAEKTFKQIKPSDFSFLSKKFKTILYLSISGLFTRTVFKINDQLTILINETGFTRLNELKLVS